MNNEPIAGITAVLLRSNIDTDQIIPKQFLKSVEKTGYGDYLFDSWRFTEPGELGMKPQDRAINPNFELNQPKFNGAKILLAGDNFGCGSSREHAVWALQQYGFEAIIAPSFAEIFADNAKRNCLPLIELSKHDVEELSNHVEQKPTTLQIYLVSRTIKSDHLNFKFEMDENLVQQIITKKDDIDLTLELSDSISEWEERSRIKTPWLWD